MPSHKWKFKSHIRTKTFGWKGTSLASKRLREAVSEIKKVAKSDPVTAADGAVALIERIWPALQSIDGSSGALGNAVNRTLDAVIPIVIEAPADDATRDKWLERLFRAIEEDQVNYLAPVEDRWAELCGSPEVASRWADRIVPLLREAWSNPKAGNWVQGSLLGLASLVGAGRYDELQELMAMRSYRFWPFDKFWAQVLLRQGKLDEAIEYAESRSKGQGDYDHGQIVEFCERLLLEAGRSEEAYRRFGLHGQRSRTNLATFREVAKRYPDRDPRQILRDLMDLYGPKGKWFAAAKGADCLDVALECAYDAWADPVTLNRAARDFVEKEPKFAAEVAVCALRNLLSGGGYETGPVDVRDACRYLKQAAELCDRAAWAETEVQKLIDGGCVPECKDLLKALIDEQR